MEEENSSLWPYAAAFLSCTGFINQERKILIYTIFQKMILLL